MKKKKKALLVLLFVLVSAIAWGGASTSRIVCQNVGTTPVTVLTPNPGRKMLAMRTTSGAPMVWYATPPTSSGGLASAHGTNSMPLAGGEGWTEDLDDYIGRLSIVSLTTSWFCVRENY